MGVEREHLFWVIAVHALANYLIFIAGAMFFFKTNQKPERRVILLKFAAVISLVLQVFLIAQTRSDDFNGIRFVTSELVFLSSTVLFLITWRYNHRRPLSEAFSTDQPKWINTGGPYRWVRHPFYVAYLLSYWGGVICTGSPVLVVQALVMVALYWDAARFEEQKFLKSKFASSYAEYCRKTGRFIPGAF